MSKARYAATLLLLVATPALSDPKKTDNNVTFECVVTGGDKDGFDLTAVNDGKDDMSCTASCQLTMSNKQKTKEYSYPNRPVMARPGKQAMGGEAALSGKPLTSPDVRNASCKKE